MKAAWRGMLCVALGLLVIVAGCRSTPEHSAAGRRGGVIHVVQSGETLWRISQRYGVSVDEIMRANQIRDVTQVKVGSRLWIPSAKGEAAPEIGDDAAPPRDAIDVDDASFQAQKARVREQLRKDLGLAFAWPLQGRLNSRFGPRGSGHHDGLDIGEEIGTSIRCAEAGRVIYSGNGLGDYGNVVIVKHAGPYSTVYAHNQTNLVKKGAFVEQGEMLALLGKTGNASGPHLHFEIRYNRTPVNPLLYLP